MDLKHSFTVPATIDETWAAFQNIESVAECFPGAQITEADGDTFTGTVKVKLGPIALVYKGTGTFTERDEATHTMVIDAKGKDKRGNGTAGAVVTATMTEAGDGIAGTTVDVVTDLAITGKPAQFGRGVIQDVSDKLLGQFVDCLQSKVGSGDAPNAAAPAAEPVASAPGDSSAAPAPTSSSATSSSTPSDRTVGQAPEPVAAPSPRSGQKSASDDQALDLGTAVLPVLAKAYWKQLLGVVAGFAMFGALLRRLRQR